MLKKAAFYLFAVLFIFAGQFLMSQGLVTGVPPRIEQTTLAGENPMARIAKRPALVYFWAEWCGVCRAMQGNVDAVIKDTPSVTVAERSDERQRLHAYLRENRLEWSVVNDADGGIGQRYGVRGVPALFFLNTNGDIVFTSVGYTSEWGIRARLWLAGLVH